MPAVGGVARRATIITQQRKANTSSQGQQPILLVLDAGNSLTGDQSPALNTQGKTSIEVMNRLGYDAVVLGQADLALGSAVLRQRIGEAAFPVLSANAVISATGELVAAPYVIREHAGRRIAIVGLSGVPVPSQSSSEGNPSGEIAVRDPLATARKIVAELRPEGASAGSAPADVIIFLSHAGTPADQQIADQVPGITAIISGGPGASETAWVSKTTGVPVFHADEAFSGHAGRILGIATLNLDSQGKLAGQKWRRVSLGTEVADDPAIAAWVQDQMK